MASWNPSETYAAADLWFLWSLFQPLHGGGSGRVTVVIPRGSGVGDIGDILVKRGVVSSSFFFQARATIERHFVPTPERIAAAIDRVVGY